jgi:hypothetical protein
VERRAKELPVTNATVAGAIVMSHQFQNKSKFALLAISNVYTDVPSDKSCGLDLLTSTCNWGYGRVRR